MYENMKREHTVLKLSVYGALVFSVSGIVIGLIVGAQMILFDGLYSLVSLGLSLLSLTASRFMNKSDMENYPFGKDKIEPLVVLIKYFVILILVIGSLASAIMALFTGGREIEVGFALLYSAIATVLCVLITWYLIKIGKNVRSALIQAEGNQWYMDSLVSVGVLIGFVISFVLLQFDNLQWLVPYIDPLMVVLVSIYFIKVPIQEMGTALREILDMPPRGTVSEEIKHFVNELVIDYQFDESFTRVSKVGKTLWVEVDFITSKELTIKEQDQIRETLKSHLDQYPHDQWLTVLFTQDRKWSI
ncbi:cation diffusion facilitator family transporter [Pelagirhabdus alkalitolerans]|uniref:Cation diffusion facilitator family transporter n=1 Tax=Pelagirhabdus alkalitolerans TaxID=1612202 RepID=A0A1G6HL69_9BACI|nr:cation diffusion facilitator family transporter [Pelagirhabdus alkalitolerans]SDB94196.1 cation diffusion facilitator family transporter [Pelagirhabdus alkalitolerans]